MPSVNGRQEIGSMRMSENLRIVLMATTFGIGVSILGNLIMRWLHIGYLRRRVISTQEDADRQGIRQDLTQRLDGELARLIIGTLIEARLHEPVDFDAEQSRHELAPLVESGLWLERIGCPVLYIALLVLMLALNFRVAALASIALISASLASTLVGVLRKHFGF
jgi:hypothetical protein